MLQEVWSFIVANIENLTTFVLGLNVFLCACNNKWNWPIGLLGVTMYGLSAYFLWGLYADAYLQIFYFATGVYGWWYWVKGKKGEEVPVSDLKRYEWTVLIMCIMMFTMMLNRFLLSSTDSEVPFLDAFTTVVSLFAQILLMYRKRSAWILWVTTNVAYIYLFHLKGLDSLMLLYVAFIGNAIFGYINWTRIMKKQEKECEFSYEKFV